MISEQQLYKRLRLLGEGSFGKAFLVECLSTHELLVLKQMDLSRMSSGEKSQIIRESKILEAMKHPNIINFREVYRTKRGKLCIVMDFAENGDLSAKIAENKRKGMLFSEKQVLDWFTQICLALKHVHDRKILHRDLKCSNIFLTKDNTIKLGDFGIARVLTNTREKAKTMVGTPYYLSPEIIENKPYDFSSDIWSLGVVLYELCALKPPFLAESLKYLALKIVKGTFPAIPAAFSKEIRSLVESLLRTERNKRPTINEILSIYNKFNRKLRKLPRNAHHRQENPRFPERNRANARVFAHNSAQAGKFPGFSHENRDFLEFRQSQGESPGNQARQRGRVQANPREIPCDFPETRAKA